MIGTIIENPTRLQLKDKLLFSRNNPLSSLFLRKKKKKKETYNYRGNLFEIPFKLSLVEKRDSPHWRTPAGRTVRGWLWPSFGTDAPVIALERARVLERVERSRIFNIKRAERRYCGRGRGVQHRVPCGCGGELGR